MSSLFLLDVYALDPLLVDIYANLVNTMFSMNSNQMFTSIVFSDFCTELICLVNRSRQVGGVHSLIFFHGKCPSSLAEWKGRKNNIFESPCSTSHLLILIVSPFSVQSLLCLPLFYLHICLSVPTFATSLSLCVPISVTRPDLTKFGHFG